MVDAANARVEAKRQTERKRQELLEVHARAPVDLKSLETDPQFHYVENKTKGLGVVPMQGRSVYVEDVEFEGENFKVVWAPVLKVNENGKLSAHVVGVVPGAAGHENDQPAAEQYFKHINDELSDAAIKTGFEVALLTIPEIKALRAARAAKALKNAERAAELEEVAMQARKATAADAEKALFGHNEYVVADTAKAGKVKESLEAFYKAKAPKGASIKWVDNVPGGRNGLINTETGEILLSKDLLIKYPQLADGVLVEELQHFHQLQSRGWIGRALTAEENALLEKEVVQRMQRSGFKIFDPRRP